MEINRMSVPEENRKYHRRRSSAPMIFRQLYSIQFNRAVELNNSAEGICFRSPVELIPGTIIQIRRGQDTKTSESRVAVAGIEESRLATTIWCDQRDGDDGYSHCCGVRYFPFDVIS